MQFTKNVELKFFILNLKNILPFLSLIKKIFSSEAKETEITEVNIKEVYDVDLYNYCELYPDNFIIYLSKRKADKKEVVIKNLTQKGCNDLFAINDFRVVRSLDHECVVKIIDKIYQNPNLFEPSGLDYFLFLKV